MYTITHNSGYFHKEEIFYHAESTKKMSDL